MWRSDSSRDLDDTGASSGSRRRNGRGVRFASTPARPVHAGAAEKSNARGKPARHADLECARHAGFDSARDSAVYAARADASTSERDTSAAASDTEGSDSCVRSTADGRDAASVRSARTNAGSARSASSYAGRADACCSIDHSRCSARRFGSACNAAATAAGDGSGTTRRASPGRVRHFRSPADQPVPCP